MRKRHDDLFGSGQFSLTPDRDRTEPRLWVRRLVIWREPGAAPLRDYSFRPGLNIVWSLSVRETAGEQEGTIGHGSGKTLLCRLMRYCLGERRFASEDQRTAIGAQFPEGNVGAEVMLDGTCWTVLRPLGHRQRHVAVVNGDLDAIAAGEGVHTGMEPFVSAIEGVLFAPGSLDLVPGGHGWLTQLAWLTRDQECEFSRVQEWRDAASGSDSPARSLTTDEAKFFALRVFLKAITPEERALGDEIKAMESERDAAKQEASHRLWEAGQKKRNLAAAFGLKEADVEGALAAEALKQAARKNLAEIARVTPISDLVDPAPLRAEIKEAQAQEKALGARLAGMKGRMGEMERTIARMKNEVVGLALSTDEDENPSCPICEVPISRVLAERCQLTDKLVDLESIRHRRENHRKDLEKEERNLATLYDEFLATEQEHEDAQALVAALDEQLLRIEDARDAHGDHWYQARRLIDDAARYEHLLQVQDTGGREFEALVGRLEGKRQQMSLYREKQKQLIARVSGIFDHIVGELIGSAATGTVRLTGNGLEQTITLGGKRDTPGTKCVKVLAFDLAALCLSTEKGAQVAPFLIHDSPRVADLDIEVYYRLFRFVKDLFESLGQPLFQYIITTTTPPPEDLRDTTWTPVKLKGAPAEARLLGCDL